MKYWTLGSCSFAVILVVAFGVPAQADECNKLTYLTFSAAVGLPGVTLPAGTYQFSHPDCSTGNDILRVSSLDGSKVYASLLAIPEERPTPSDQPAVVLAEMPPGAPEALKAWFYPGETVGDELIYPKGEARRIAHAGDRSGVSTTGVR